MSELYESRNDAVKLSCVLHRLIETEFMQDRFVEISKGLATGVDLTVLLENYYRQQYHDQKFDKQSPRERRRLIMQQEEDQSVPFLTSNP
jgi:hypothetical protein